MAPASGAILLALSFGCTLVACTTTLDLAATTSLSVPLTATSGAETSLTSTGLATTGSPVPTSAPVSCGNLANPAATITTITKSEDLSAIVASCTTYAGSILITSGPEGESFLPYVVDLGVIREITGSLNVTTNLQLGISANNLQRVGDHLWIYDIEELTDIDLPNLDHVGTDLWFHNLPELKALNLSTALSVGVSTEISNTGLTSLDGSSLNIVSPTWFSIINNPNLGKVSLPIGNSPGASITLLQIHGNGLGMSVEFPELTLVGNMSFAGVSQLSLPKLDRSTGDISINGSQLFNLTANALTAIGTSLTLDSVVGLQNLSFEGLRYVGENVNITLASQLDAINLPDLQTVGGFFSATGGFTSVDVPKLADIQKDFNIQSEQSVSCSQLRHLAEGNNPAIKGKYTCLGKNAITPSTGEGMSRATKIGTGVGVSVVVILICGLVYLYQRRVRRKKAQKNTEAFEKEAPNEGPVELGRTASGKLKSAENRHELQDKHGVSELVNPIYELEGDHGAKEMHQREKFSFEEKRTPALQFHR